MPNRHIDGGINGISSALGGRTNISELEDIPGDSSKPPPEELLDSDNDCVSEDFSYVSEADEYVQDYWPDAEPTNEIWTKISIAGLFIAAFAWISIYFTARLWPLPEIMNADALVGHIMAITPPLAVCLLMGLFIRRGARAEARRYDKVTQRLAFASHSLQQELTQMNNALSHNLGAIQQNASQLSNVGADVSERLSVQSLEIERALTGSTAQAQQLSMIMDTAVGNLDRLVKDTPGTTQKAKDIANAIAEAGMGANQNVRTLIDLLANAQSAHSAANDSFETMSARADTHLSAFQAGLISHDKAWNEKLISWNGKLDELTCAFDNKVTQSGERLVGHISEADVRVSALLNETQSAGRNISNLVSEQLGLMARSSRNHFKDLEEQLAEIENRLVTARTETSAHSEAEMERLVHALDTQEERISVLHNEILSNNDAVAHRLNQSLDEMLARLQSSHEEFDAVELSRNEAIQSQIKAIRQSIQSVTDIRVSETDALRSLLHELDSKYEGAAKRVHNLAENGNEQVAKLAFALKASSQNVHALTSSLSDNDAAIDGLIERNQRLGFLIETNSAHISDTLTNNLARFAERLGEIRENISEQSSLTRDLENQGERLLVQFGKLDRRIAEQHAALDRLSTVGQTGLVQRADEAEKLGNAIQFIRDGLQEISTGGEGQISAILSSIEGRGASMLDAIREELAQLGEESVIKSLIDDTAIQTLANERGQAFSSAFMDGLEGPLNIAESAADKLERRLNQLTEMTGALEMRIDHASENFDLPDDEAFARRLALLTEALNSAAIDVAKILSNEVTDTAWQNYLKGDRGVFTRRAVRLLDQKESRIIADHYDDDSEFRMQVNRYIHDFEDMMRQLLSTRDGHRISVTLLSSDVGKLYVALAQAIERLRS